MAGRRRHPYHIPCDTENPACATLGNGAWMTEREAIVRSRSARMTPMGDKKQKPSKPGEKSTKK